MSLTNQQHHTPCTFKACPNISESLPREPCGWGIWEDKDELIDCVEWGFICCPAVSLSLYFSLAIEATIQHISSTPKELNSTLKWLSFFVFSNILNSSWHMQQGFHVKMWHCLKLDFSKSQTTDAIRSTAVPGLIILHNTVFSRLSPVSLAVSSAQTEIPYPHGEAKEVDKLAFAWSEYKGSDIVQNLFRYVFK